MNGLRAPLTVFPAEKPARRSSRVCELTVTGPRGLAALPGLSDVGGRGGRTVGFPLLALHAADVDSTALQEG